MGYEGGRKISVGGWGHTLECVPLEMLMTTLSRLSPVFMVLMMTVIGECSGMNFLGCLVGGMFHDVSGPEVILTS